METNYPKTRIRKITTASNEEFYIPEVEVTYFFFLKKFIPFYIEVDVIDLQSGHGSNDILHYSPIRCDDEDYAKRHIRLLHRLIDSQAKWRLRKTVVKEEIV